MKVRNPFDTHAITRVAAAALLVATLTATVGAIPVALAETVPAPGVAAVATTMSDVVSTAATASPAAITTATAFTTGTAPVATGTAPVATPTVPPARAKAKKLTVRQIVAKVGRGAGLSTREVTALLWICKRESNFHPKSKSRSGYHGLFQLSKGMAKGHPWKDPVWNTKRAIKYMRGRYGGALQAKAFWLRHHWY